MSKQQTTSACPHPEAVGTRWGDPISEERKTKLQGYLDRWAVEKDRGTRQGPYHGIRLTGAEVCWLTQGRGVRDDDGFLTRLHLEGVDLHNAHLEGAELSGARLAGADFFQALLEGADLSAVRLGGAILFRTHLEGANLSRTWLDSNTILDDAVLDKTTELGDIHWGGKCQPDSRLLDWHVTTR
jgi:Pentapeptide repeats (8 copies)